MAATGQSGLSPGLLPTFLLFPHPPLAGKHSISVTALTSPGIIGQHSILGCTFEPDIQMDSIAIQ